MLNLETCLRLKEAGWPQEEGEFGFYSPDGGMDFIRNQHRAETYAACGYVRVAACPALEELLAAIRELSGLYELRYDRESKLYRTLAFERYGDSTAKTKHTDPCEAAAALWLKLKAGE